MTIRDYFDSVQAINLRSRLDRRRQISRELARHGMPLEPGRVELFDAVRPDDAGGFTSIGARGCFLSHLGVLTQARAAGRARVLVIEDDLQITRRLARLAPSMIDRLRANDWGIVYFGHPIELPPETPTGLVAFDGPVGLTHFFGVNGTIFDRLIAFLEEILLRPPGHPDGGPMFPDAALTTFRARNPDVLTLLASPNLGWQRSSRTDLHDLRWFDRMPVVNRVVGVARRGRCWLNSYR
jgi:glycosyl transferase, family 25